MIKSKCIWNMYGACMLVCVCACVLVCVCACMETNLWAARSGKKAPIGAAAEEQISSAKCKVKLSQFNITWLSWEIQLAHFAYSVPQLPLQQSTLLCNQFCISRTFLVYCICCSPTPHGPSNCTGSTAPISSNAVMMDVMQVNKQEQILEMLFSFPPSITSLKLWRLEHPCATFLTSFPLP